MSARPTAALTPPPYLNHRTVAEVWADEQRAHTRRRFDREAEIAAMPSPTSADDRNARFDRVMAVVRACPAGLKAVA